MELEIMPIKLGKMDKRYAEAIAVQTKRMLSALAIPKELLGDSMSRARYSDRHNPLNQQRGSLGRK